MRIEPRPLPAQLPDLGDLPPLLTRLYAARGVQSAAELDKGLARLIPYQQLKGIDAAVDLLVQALQQRQRILIVGDFDADGATASSVGVLGLRMLGAAHVDYLVPNRFEYGYGLTPEIVAVALQRQPELLVTVDNGISSVDGVAAAKEAGLKVLVTDHHLPGPELPAADAIVNPNQPGCAFPSKALAGVGVMFYVLLALRARLRELGWFAKAGISEPNLGELLDLVALGSVADVVPLDANNRILVHQGLARIRAGRARPGLRAVLEVAGRQHARITSTDLGFILGPRLNAAGRLDDMSLGIECLLCEDEALARDMAQQLDELNKDRKAIEQGMQREALAQLKDLPLADMPFGLCLFEPDWHQGVIGILASRLKERYHRPAIAFADAGDGLLKGSARSVPGLHIRDALDMPLNGVEYSLRVGNNLLGLTGDVTTADPTKKQVLTVKASGYPFSVQFNSPPLFSLKRLFNRAGGVVLFLLIISSLSAYILQNSCPYPPYSTLASTSKSTSLTADTSTSPSLTITQFLFFTGVNVFLTFVGEPLRPKFSGLTSISFTVQISTLSSAKAS